MVLLLPFSGGRAMLPSGPILRAGMPPLIFYCCYSLIGLITASTLFLIRGDKETLLSQLRGLSAAHAGWFLFSLLAASLAALMTYMAIGEKNATLASMIEISYPLLSLFSLGFSFRNFNPMQ